MPIRFSLTSCCEWAGSSHSRPKPEDLFPIVDETAEVVEVDLDVLVPAGNYDGAIAVEESTRLAPGTELKWYAPGVSVVKVQTKGETLRLESSTLVQPPDD